MADINKVWVSGLVTTDPVYTKLASRTPITFFTLQINERFNNYAGSQQVRPNFIRIESLGKHAETVSERVKAGTRWIVDGYIRQDDNEIKIRTFAVNPEDMADSASYREGLKHAIEVMRRSRDIRAAIDRLEELTDGPR